MQSAKKALGMTKYFVSLPSSRQLAGAMLLINILFGAATGFIASNSTDLNFAISGAATALAAIAFPSFICAIALSLFRRKVNLRRALALALVSNIIYLASIFAASASQTFLQESRNIIFVGFGFSFLAWLITLRFAFGLKRSCWLFAIFQMLLQALFLFAASTVLAESLDSILLKTILASFVFVGALYSILFLASGPLKKNLGLSSGDALSKFLSQWLYGDTELEDALDEMGEFSQTWIGTATFKTRHGRMQWIIPYFHFGPFGNLGASQFPSKIEAGVGGKGICTFVFHGTATHALDPVSSQSLHAVLQKCKEGLKSAKLEHAHYCIGFGRESDSFCRFFKINRNSFSFFSRAPLSTEDINLAVGWALMEKAKDGGESLAIDCHNCETGEVDYIEPGSLQSAQMSDALDNAIKSTGLLAPMLAGWACAYPSNIHGIASGGIKIACFGSKSKKPSFFVLLDANGIVNEARERLEGAIKSKYPESSVDICTSDTHELNAVKGVFNPVGEQDLERLETIILSLADEAHSKLSPCEFGMAKPRIILKVLGPYQSAEIVSTINAVISLLKVAVPVILLAAIFAAIWVLGNL